MTGITISPSQLAFAQERLAAEIKAGSVSLELTDYREISGSFDAVVSIEMFEAVGREWWSTYMKTLRGRVKPGARAVVQTITINDELFDSYVEQPDFIQTCIFPGSLLSCPSQFKDHARAAGLEAEGDHFFGLSYAETLRRWQQAFNAEEDSVRDLGFDTEFIRLWNVYMSYCIGGFEAERTNVAQLHLGRLNHVYPNPSTPPCRKGWLPDALCRLGIRRLCRATQALHTRGRSDERRARLAAWVETMDASPVAMAPEESNEHYEVPSAFLRRRQSPP